MLGWLRGWGWRAWGCARVRCLLWEAACADETPLGPKGVAAGRVLKIISSSIDSTHFYCERIIHRTISHGQKGGPPQLAG